MSWLARRTGLAGVAGLVEKLILSAAGVLSTNKQMRHLGGIQRYTFFVLFTIFSMI